MSLRYQGAWLQNGAFDPLIAPTPIFFEYGPLYSWGRNNSGQLGLSNTTYRSSPNQVGSLTNWQTITNGSNSRFSLVIKNDNTLWSWGNNTNGELGLGNRTNYSSPKQVGSLTDWLKVSSGYGYTMAVKTNGTLWGWGRNFSGELGLGNITQYSSPKQVGSLTTWLSVSCSYSSTFAIRTNYTLWTWGFNSVGQLGLGNTTSRSSPVQVGALTNWLAVAGSKEHTVAVKTDGTLWSWGKNNFGQLGLGTASNYVSYSSPKQVGSLTNWLNVTCGSLSSAAIKIDGTIWSWGSNAGGTLGLNNVTDRSSPVQIGALTGWSSIKMGRGSGSGSAVLSLKTNGSIWSWGSNPYGELGLGNRTDYSSPKQIGALTIWQSVGMQDGHAMAILGS